MNSHVSIEILVHDLRHNHLLENLPSLTESELHEYLNHRDSHAFEQKWLGIHQEIEKLEPEDKLDTVLINLLEELVFKKILTKYGEKLAKYVCDDFELIAKGIACSIHSTDLENIYNSYQTGKFPTFE